MSTRNFQLSADNAAKTASSAWTIWSDVRFKTDIQPYTAGSNEILQINPVTYKLNGKGGIGYSKAKSKDP